MLYLPLVVLSRYGYKVYSFTLPINSKSTFFSYQSRDRCTIHPAALQEFASSTLLCFFIPLRPGPHLVGAHSAWMPHIFFFALFSSWFSQVFPPFLLPIGNGRKTSGIRLREPPPAFNCAHAAKRSGVKKHQRLSFTFVCGAICTIEKCTTEPLGVKKTYAFQYRSPSFKLHLGHHMHFSRAFTSFFPVF